MPEPLDTLRQIAADHLRIRNLDRMIAAAGGDIHHIPTKALHRALQAAYEAGQRHPDAMTVRAALVDAADAALAHARKALREERSPSAAEARTRYALDLLDALEAVNLYVDHGEGQ